MGREAGHSGGRRVWSVALFVLKQEGVDLIGKLGLSEDEKDKVYCRNAKQLLKL
jgi:hypothetical protein